MTEPENLVLHLLREMRAEMATKSELAAIRVEMREGFSDVRSEMRTGFANVAADMLDLEKRLGEQVKSLRLSVMHYHSTILGHAELLTELEGRVKRLEERLNLVAPETTS